MANVSSIPFKYIEKTFTLIDETNVCRFRKEGGLIEVKINGKQVLYPSSGLAIGLNVLATKIVTIRNNSDHLIELDVSFNNGTTKTVYIEINRDSEALYATREPLLLPLPDILKKCSSIKQEHPDFKCSVACYNEYGVVLYGKIGKTKTLFFANPHEEKVQKIKEIERRVHLSDHHVTIPDNPYFHFCWDTNDQLSINRTPATHIPVASLGY